MREQPREGTTFYLIQSRESQLSVQNHKMDSKLSL